MEAPLPVYEVVGAGPLRTRLQVAARRGLTRFVCRHTELEQLQRALEHAKAGHGQIVGVMGEPGLGKSRLFYEFKLLSHSRCLALEAYSVSHGKASPYLPLIELLKSYLQLQPQDDTRTRRQKVIGKVLELDRSLEDTVPYLYALLGVEDQPSPLQQMDPQIRRQRTFAALKKLFLRESVNQPVILIIEDLHWFDSETQGFVDILSESVASAKLLLLTNYRPEYRPKWGQKTYSTQLRLASFGQAEAEEFLDVLLGEAGGARQPSPFHALKQLILEKTEGTPFFMEEVVQTLAEEGVLSGDRGHYRLEKAPSELHISPTLQGVLAARIDHLAADEKALLQQLAVIGREFPLSLVRQVLSQPEEELYRVLSSLQRKEFLYEQPAFPEVEYHFKHALTQEVAYNTLLIERRKVLHEQTARAMEQLYRERMEEHYSALAHHYQHSENTEKAIEYLQKAGRQAVLRLAHADAITHLTAALDRLMTLPDSTKRTQQELTLQLALAMPLMVTKGFAAPEVGAVRTRALELCRQIGETLQLFPALLGACAFYVMRGELQTAQELAERLIPLAQQAQDSALLLEAHYVLGTVLYSVGKMVLARTHHEQALALYDPQQRQEGVVPGEADRRATGLSFHANVLWLLGYPDQALAQSRTALSLAQERAYPFTTALAEALTLVEKNGERMYKAELYRLKGKLTLQKGARDWELGAGSSSLQAPSLKPLVPSGAVEEAEEYFLKAVEIAQKQQAKSWELRATVSLARLWQRQGRQAEAHNLLSEIYTWFTEGFDTKDLQEAKALLAELT